jgi:methylmalonyl-CoA mutase
MATEKLLQEFPPISTQEWEEKIVKDLKGADPKKLIWKSDEGLAVKPFYRAEDIASLPHLGGAPGDYPYTRGARESADWLIREQIEAKSAAEANQAAQAAIKAGAEEVSFCACLAKNAADVKTLLSGLTVPVRIEPAKAETLPLLTDCKNSISAAVNPLDNLDEAAKLLSALPENITPFTIDGVKLEEAGATGVEQIAYALAAGVEYMNAVLARGADTEKAASAVAFSFAIGSSYFYEIAKFRAFRALWAQAAESFGVKGAGAKARIYARTSRWTKTVYDPHVNVLRSTTEAMSAILGGVDSVLVEPFDTIYKQSDEASQRLARNTQILLKKEAMLEHVADPGAGSYCIEYFTDYMAEEAWKKMQAVEAAGGFLKAKESVIVPALKASLEAKKKAVAVRKRVFTGSNQYANLNEKALGRIDAPRVSALERATTAYEQLRFRTERSGKAPKFLLAEIGDAKMRSARSGFAANFFGCAGFALTTQRFDTVDEIAAAQADVYVLCSSDAEYLDLTKQLAAKTKKPIVIAGNPENTAELTAAGAVDFIHVRSNPIEVLTTWQKRLGIEG